MCVAFIFCQASLRPTSSDPSDLLKQNQQGPQMLDPISLAMGGYFLADTPVDAFFWHSSRFWEKKTCSGWIMNNSLLVICTKHKKCATYHLITEGKRPFLYARCQRWRIFFWKMANICLILNHFGLSGWNDRTPGGRRWLTSCFQCFRWKVFKIFKMERTPPPQGSVGNGVRATFGHFWPTLLPRAKTQSVICKGGGHALIGDVIVPRRDGLGIHEPLFFYHKVFDPCFNLVRLRILCVFVFESWCTNKLSPGKINNGRI